MGRLSVADIADLIRDIPDFPEPGIVFKDITPLLAHPDGLASTIEALADPWRDDGLGAVAGVEARGFILGAAVAQTLGVGFVPIRKAGKLPGDTVRQDYGLEYGSDTIEIHADAVDSGRRVLVLDDVLATGGTAAAANALLARVGAEVVGFSFLRDLAFLGGRSKLGDARVEALIEVGA